MQFFFLIIQVHIGWDSASSSSVEEWGYKDNLSTLKPTLLLLTVLYRGWNLLHRKSNSF